MDKIQKKVLNTLKWKKSNSYCAEKLGMSKSEYIKHKRKVLSSLKNNKQLDKSNKAEDFTHHVNLQTGECKISGVSNKEVKSPDEIIKLLKIDTKKWKLSQYWNKQMSDHWRISALITQIKNVEDIAIKELIDNWKPKKFIIPEKPLKTLNKSKVCGVMSLQDIHFGKEGNETIDKDFEEAIKDLLPKASSFYFIDVLYFVIGGDLINMDTFNGTTTSGTPVDNSCSATEAYIKAFDAMQWAIGYMKQFCNQLVIVYMPGNHDRLTSFHLAHALSKSIQSDKIEWDIEYAERKVHTWGNNFNAFEHGDVSSKNTPLIYASEFSEKWGVTKHRTLYTGHYHKNKKVEHVMEDETVGFVFKILPSLSRKDYWHYHKKFTGNRRSAILELQDYKKGEVAKLVYSAE